MAFFFLTTQVILEKVRTIIGKLEEIEILLFYAFIGSRRNFMVVKMVNNELMSMTTSAPLPPIHHCADNAAFVLISFKKSFL